MAVLENIIRPYETPDVAPAQRYVASGQKSSNPILLQLGRSGQGKVFQGNSSVKETVYMDAAENETHNI